MKRGWVLATILRKLFPKTIKRIVNDEVTEAIHPEFGWIWNKGELGDLVWEAGRDAGWIECLVRVQTDTKALTKIVKEKFSGS